MKSRDITALCLCTLIGAGFATGRELVTYFVRYGIYGFIGIALASVMFGAAIYMILKSPYKSIKELTEKRLSPIPAFIADKTAFLFLIVLYSGMLAASGEVFSEILGIDKGICRMISAVLCTVVICSGADVLTQLSRILIVPMAVIIFVASAYLSGRNISIPPENVLNIRTVISPFIYLSYNMISAVALIISLPDTKKPKFAAIETALCIFMLSVVSALPLYTHYSDICSEPLPLMSLLKGRGMLKYAYMLFLLSAIFTTAVNSGYSALLRISDKGKNLLPACMITIFALFISAAGFNKIVDNIYFVFGIMGFILLWCLK